MDELPYQYGRYHLQQRLGRGGMAEVFRATVDGPGGFQRAVAIKRILPEYGQDEWFTRMIADEARIVSRLSHPNIVQILDTGTIDGSWYIAFELVEGTDMFNLLQTIYGRGQALPMAFACYIVAEVVAGLDHAHSRRDENGHLLGIVHRDVSPQNVLLSWLGEVKLGDFGIARATQRSSDTQAGTIKGKVYYMSPEQARGETVDHRSDLFSAGILLYEALTTQPMYDDEDPGKLLETVALGRWKWPADAELKIPAALRQVVTTALAVDVKARFQSGRAMREALLAAMATCGLRADRDSLGAWLRAQNQVPDDRPPEPTGEQKRWHSSHRVQLVPAKSALPSNDQTVAIDPPKNPTPAKPRVAVKPQKPLPTPQPIAVAPPIAAPPPPPNWQMPEIVQAPLPDRASEPASVGLLTATTLVWLVAIVLGTLAALMARE
jgi:serine/threonine protein kinase